MEIHLDRAFADKRIFPSFDVEKSGTRHDELLIDKKIVEKIATLRRMLALLSSDERLVALIEKLKKTKNNEEFLKKLNG
jgi:transcription termination factor Rho